MFIFGGVSDIKEEERIKEDYNKEFKIAVVGPLTGFALAGAFALTWWLLLQASNTNEFAPEVPQFQGEDRARQEIPGFVSSVSIVSGVLLYGAMVNALLWWTVSFISKIN